MFMAEKLIITEEVKKQNNMAFKMRSGNKVSFKNMGSSPARNMKDGSYEHSFESPAKQRLNKGGEGQDQNKIFNDKGEHVGDYVNDKPVMKPGFKRPVVKKDTPVKPTDEDMYKYSDLEKYDDDRPVSFNKQKQQSSGKDKVSEQQTSELGKKVKALLKKGYLPTKKANISPAKQAKTKGLGPRTAFGGVKNPELVKTKKTKGKKAMIDGPKKQVTGVKNPGNWQPHPNTFKAKKSTVSKHGQLDDAEIEYQNDLKLLKEMAKNKKKK